MASRCADCQSTNIQTIGPQQMWLTIFYEGRQVEYVVRPKQQMEFEKRMHVPWSKLDSMQHAYALAHLVQFANKDDYPGPFPADLDQWADGVLVVEVEQRDLVPFAPAASGNGSLASLLPAGSHQSTS